jgi:hypothetical protein
MTFLHCPTRARTGFIASLELRKSQGVGWPPLDQIWPAHAVKVEDIIGPSPDNQCLLFVGIASRVSELTTGLSQFVEFPD